MLKELLQKTVETTNAIFVRLKRWLVGGILRWYRMKRHPQRATPRQQAYSISVFNKGDIVTRLEKSAREDGSYRGDPLRYLGILNNQIVYQHADDHNGLPKNRKYTLDLEDWQYGWGLYKNPNKVAAN